MPPYRLMAALAAMLIAVAASGAETLSPVQQRGADLYHNGKSAAGPPVFAQIGGTDVHLPGTALPCAGCHGPDGLGRPEGGIAPVPLTWDHLTKPYGHRHAGGRDHPAFTEATLKRAITQGVDPAGNRLDPAMPRFNMAEEDLDALIAYLKELGRGDTPGVAATTITLGMLVAGEGRLATAGDAAASLVQDYIDEINAQAGVYGRTLVLKAERLPGDPAAATAALDRLIEEPVFALLAAIPPGLQVAVAEMTEAAAVPTFHLWPPAMEASPDRQHYNFYLLAGLRQEIEALVRFADGSISPGGTRVALVVSPSDRDGPAMHAVTRRWTDAAKITAPVSMEEARRLAGRLKSDGTDVLCILARHEGVAMLLEGAAEIGWFPTVLAPGSLAGEELRTLAQGFEGKVYLAYPMTPADRDEDHLARLGALRAHAEATARHTFGEATAYGAVSLLLEALRLTGREVSRDALIAAVESLHRFRTGAVPPLTYGRNRRIGAADMRIVRAQ